MKPVLVPLEALRVHPVTKADALKVGDQIRFSVEFIEQIWNDESVDRAMLVEVREIRLEHDGSKTLVLQRPSYTAKAES